MKRFLLIDTNPKVMNSYKKFTLGFVVFNQDNRSDPYL